MKEKFGLGSLYAIRRGNVSDPFSSSSGLLSVTKVMLQELSSLLPSLEKELGLRVNSE